MNPIVWLLILVSILSFTEAVTVVTLNDTQSTTFNKSSSQYTIDVLLGKPAPPEFQQTDKFNYKPHNGQFSQERPLFVIKELFQKFDKLLRSVLKVGISAMELYCFEETGTMCESEGWVFSDRTPPANSAFRIAWDQGSYPFVAGSGACGNPGDYIYLPYSLFEEFKGESFKQIRYKLFGNTDLPKWLLALWLEYRYGVPHDSGCYGHTWFPDVVSGTPTAFHVNNEGSKMPQLIHNSCAGKTLLFPDAQGSHYNSKDCALGSFRRAKNLEFIRTPLFCRVWDLNKYSDVPPEHSLTSLPWIELEGNTLCNTENHDHLKPTPLSIICPLKGQWEIINAHDDFKQVPDRLVLDEVKFTTRLVKQKFSSVDTAAVYAFQYPAPVYSSPTSPVSIAVTFRLMWGKAVVVTENSDVYVKVSKPNQKVRLFDDGNNPDPYPSVSTKNAFF